MARITCWLIFLAIFFPLVVCDEFGELINLLVRSEIDLTKKLLLKSHSVIFTNNATRSTNSYYFTCPNDSILVTKFKNEDGVELKYVKRKDHVYEIILDEEVEQGRQYKIDSEFVLVDKITPALKKCGYDEKQLMKFEDNILFYSPYKTESLTVKINSHHQSDYEMTEVIPTEVLTYKSLAPYSVENVVYYFHSSNIMIVVKLLKRTIDVSQYGKITITDKTFLENIGCKVTGAFRGGVRSAFYKHLPASAEDVAHYDDLGKISSWDVYRSDDSVLMWLKTRFPLHGGWKIDNTVRYRVPLHEHLHVLDAERYVLHVRGVDHAVNDSVIEHARTVLVLPEGARVLDVRVPDYLALKDVVDTCAGFCVLGRRALIVEGGNLSHDHVDAIRVEYLYRTGNLLRAPLALSLYVLTVFLCVILSTRVLNR